jgi:predicted ATPase/DNA-binding CsgD family transcriptional regulator
MLVAFPGGCVTSLPSLVAGQPLFGRSAETETLLGLLERTEQGLGAAAFIRGEAGIGKTSLAVALAGQALARGFRVLQGAASELERDRPFGALAQAFEIGSDSSDRERAGMARLLLGEAGEGPEPGRPPGVRFRLIEAFVSLAERLGLAGPVLVVVEDLHWADPSTVLALDHLGRRLVHLPVVLLGTYRPSPRSADLGRVVGHLVDQGALHLPLGPLDDGAVASLVADVAGAPPGPELLLAAAGAAGNPLFVTELVRELRAEGVLRIVGGVADVEGRVVPPSFQLLVLRELSLLPEPALHVLRVASIMGASFSLADLATVLGRRPSDLLGALEEAFTANVLGQAGDSLAFRHELVREAVYLDLPLAVRRGLHLQAGRALAAAGATAVQVATHMSRGADLGDAEAAEWLRRAAGEAAPRAPAVAVALLGRALELAPAGYSHRDAVATELVEALLWSGRLPEAVDRARQLLGRDQDAQRRNAVQLSILRALGIEGQLEEASRQIESAMATFEGDERQRLELDVQAALIRLFSGDAKAARAAAEDALARADRLGADAVRQQAYSVIGLAAFLTGAIPRAIEATTLGLERTGPLSIAAHGFEPHFFLGTALIEADRLGEADRVLREGQRIAEELGMTWQLAQYHGQIGLQRIAAGQWDDAIAELEAAVVAAEETGVAAVFYLALMAVIAVHRGSLVAAAGHVARAEREVASGVRLGADAAMWASALLQEARGDFAAALSALEGAWQLDRTLGFRSQYVRLGVDLTRLAVAAGRPELAHGVAEAMEEAAAVNPAPSWRGSALVCRGLAEADAGALRAAVQAYRESPRPAERAWALVEAGAAMGRAGHREEAIAWLTEGQDDCEELGAVRDVARAGAALRGLGVRRGRRGSRRRPPTGWDSLTPTELEVVALVAEGLTNAEIGGRLFISGRTVESHLSHVFAKLSIASKLQLAAEAARRLAPKVTARPAARRAP